MVNVIIVAVIVVIFIIGIRSSIKHMKGESSCCGGGGGSLPTEPKKLEGTIIAKKIVYIEGMHCENCKNSVERQINRIDGASATANWKKNIAVVSMDRLVSDEEITRAVEMADFTVVRIELQEA